MRRHKQRGARFPPGRPTRECHCVQGCSIRGPAAPSPPAKRCEARDLNFFAMEIWRRRLIQNEGEVGPMQKLPQTLNTFADATILLMIIVFIALAAWLLAQSG